MKQLSFSILVVVLLALFASAQTSRGNPNTSIRISGMVRLGNSVAPQGVQIVVESHAGGIAGQATTDNSGQFAFTNIGSGVYTVRAHQPGYADASEDVDTRITSSAFITLTLKLLDGAVPVPPSGTVPGV